MAVFEGTYTSSDIDPNERYTVSVYRYDYAAGILWGFAMKKPNGELAANFSGDYSDIRTRMEHGSSGQPLPLAGKPYKPDGCACSVRYSRTILSEQRAIHKGLVALATSGKEGLFVVYMDRDPATQEYGLIQVTPFNEFVMVSQ